MSNCFTGVGIDMVVKRRRLRWAGYVARIDIT